MLADEFEGRFLLGKVDVDTSPQLAQALQIPSVPLVALVVQGRMMPLLQDAPPLAELRTLMTQVLEQMATQGVTGRHQPLSAAPAPDAADDEEYVDPRYAPAQDALAAGDIDGAVAEYQKLVDANPADAEAAGGLAMAKVLQRTQGVDARRRPRGRRRANRDDVDAQTLVADLDMLGGHVEDAFTRLIDLVRRTAGASGTRRARTCWACSPPSATTTPGCSRAARGSPPRCSDPPPSRRERRFRPRRVGAIAGSEPLESARPQV